MPDELENYTHRIGRTGRAKRHGVAYTFIATITEGWTEFPVHRLLII